MTQVAGYHTHKLTVYLPAGEDTYQLKPWLVLDRENDLVVVRSSHHTRPQAMMWMFRNLTCKGQDAIWLTRKYANQVVGVREDRR